MKRSETRDQIAYAFLKLSAETPVDAIRIKDFVSTAGVNKSTYYYNFNEVGEIRNYVVNAFIADLEAYVEDQIDSSKSIFPRLEDVFLSLFKFIYDNRENFKLLFNGSISGYFTSALSEFFISFFTEWKYPVADEASRAKLHTENQYRLYMTASMFIGIITLWQKRDFEETPEDILHMVFSVLNLKPGDFFTV